MTIRDTDRAAAGLLLITFAVIAAVTHRPDTFWAWTLAALIALAGVGLITRSTQT